MRSNHGALYRIGISISLIVVALATEARGAAPLPLQTLAPGATVQLQRDTPINIVLIGYDGIIDDDAFVAELTEIVGTPATDDDGNPALGLRFDLQYNVFHVPQWFEDAFFGTLRAIAFPQGAVVVAPGWPPLPLTFAQALYTYCNVSPSYDPAMWCHLEPAPRVNRRMMTQNHVIDAGAVEKILALNLYWLGVDVTEATVVLINWWGREDYIDHIYFSADEPTPETGFPRGFEFLNTMGGYGGTPVDDPETCQSGGCIPHRLWFHDLSAGPFQRSGWDLISPESRAQFPNGVPDYRLHHIADYLDPSPETYRPLDTLEHDLADRLVNDVFIGATAFANPVYPSDLSPPLLPYHVELDINRFAWDPPRSFDGLLDVPLLIEKMNVLPYVFTTEIGDARDDGDDRLQSVWDCWLSATFDPLGLGSSCYGNRVGGVAFADLYLYFSDHRASYLEGDADYELPIFMFQPTPDRQPPFEGFADGDYTEPGVFGNRQSFVWMSSQPWYEARYAHGRTLEHEVGHHLGLSHPHNGYRCFDETCSELRGFAAQDDTLYMWHGDHVAGVMSYVRVSNDWSRFERDNLARYRTWDYLYYANQILALVVARPQSLRDAVIAALEDADAHAGNAIAAFQAGHYEDGAYEARVAYDTLVAVAYSLRIPLEPEAWPADLRPRSPSHLTYKELVRMTVDDADEVNNPTAILNAANRLGGSTFFEGLSAPMPAAELPIPRFVAP